MGIDKFCIERRKFDILRNILKQYPCSLIACEA